MFEQQSEFEKETELLFEENPGLEEKVGKVKAVLENLLKVMQGDEDIRISYGVFMGFQQLANSPVRAYRSLKVLKEVKSSFDPTFPEEDQCVGQMESTP